MNCPRCKKVCCDKSSEDDCFETVTNRIYQCSRCGCLFRTSEEVTWMEHIESDLTTEQLKNMLWLSYKEIVKSTRYWNSIDSGESDDKTT